MRRLVPFALVVLGWSFVGSIARAETSRVGPGEAYATIQDTLALLGPGDVVEVMGGLIIAE